MARDSQYLNSGLAQTGTANEAGSIPKYDANGNLPASSLVAASTLAGYDANGNLLTNALKLTSAVIAGTGTSAGSLSNNVGLYFWNGTSNATYTLPAESNAVNVHFTMVNSTTNTLTIAPNGAELINGSTNTVTVPTNVAGSGSSIATFRADPSTNSGFLKV